MFQQVVHALQSSPNTSTIRLPQYVYKNILARQTLDCDCIPKKCRLNLLQNFFQGWCSDIIPISAFHTRTITDYRLMPTAVFN